MLKTNRGEGKFGLLVILVIVVAGIYVGFKWGYAAWDAGNFRDEINQSVVYWSSHGAPPQENIIFEIMQKAEATGIDLYEEDIELETRGKFMRITINWETPLTFPFDYIYYLPFTVERELRLQ